MADEFGGIAVEENKPTDEFGGSAYTPEQLEEYGAYKKPLPLGQRLIDKYFRPTAQGLGTAGGIILGGGSGGAAGTAVAPGPGTVAGATGGAIVGGGLGFAIGDEIADILQELLGYYKPLSVMMNLQEAGENVREGLTYEMGGAALGPAAGLVGKGVKKIPGVGRATDWVSSMFPKTDKQSQETAGKVLAAFMGDEKKMIVKNMEEARAFEELIPGLKFDLGQLTGDVDVVRFVKEGIDDPAKLAVTRAQRLLDNTKAIQEFIEKTKSAGGVEDLKKPLTAQQKLTQEAEEIAQMNLAKQQKGLESKTSSMDLGTTMRTEMEAGETAARETAAEKFAAVPEQNLIVDDIYDEFRKIMKKKHADEQSDKFPPILRSAIKTMEDSVKPTKGVGAVADDVLAKARADIAKEKVLYHGTNKAAVNRIKKEGFKVKKGLAHNITESFEEASSYGKGKVLWREGESHYVLEMKPSGEVLKIHKISPKGKSTEIAKTLDPKTLKPIAKAESKSKEGKPIKSLTDLQGLRSEILEDLRQAKDKGKPRSLRARLAAAVDIIDKKLSMGAEGKKLQEAQKYFREEVIEKYHKGTMRDVMRGEESVQDAMVAGKFFRPGPRGEQAASEFMNAMGDSKAANAALREHIDQQVFKLRSDKTGEITKSSLNRWLKQHKPALKKLGLEDKYNSLVKARGAADEALAKSKEFDKSVASKVLNSDVEGVVKNAFAGTGSKKKAAEDLISQVSDNLKAVKGLQNTMIDEILTEVPLEEAQRELLSSTKMAQQFRKYDPALKVIFKDSPKKLKAMHTVRKAVKALEYKTGEKAAEGERYAADVVRRIAFLHGHSTVAATDIARKTVRVLKGISKEKIHKYINRGILDPETAYELIQATRSKSEKKITQTITQSLVRLGLIRPKESKRRGGR